MTIDDARMLNLKEKLQRLELLEIQTGRLKIEAEGCDDIDRLRAIRAELVIISKGIADLREENALEELERIQDARDELKRSERKFSNLWGLFS